MEILSGIAGIFAVKWTWAVILPLIFGWILKKMDYAKYRITMEKYAGHWGYLLGAGISKFMNATKLRVVWDNLLEPALITFINRVLFQTIAMFFNGLEIGLKSDNKKDA